MSFRDDFLAGVQAFMTKYTLYLPGEGQDGGKVDFNDPAFTALQGNNNPIVYPTAVSRAAWRQGVKPNHVKLVLELSRAYKMLPTGRTMNTGSIAVPVLTPLAGQYERDKEAQTNIGVQAGRTNLESRAAAKEAMRKAKMKIEQGEWFDCYFLPYTNGRVSEIQLGGGAHYFFTATMNGCSFLVTGGAQNPTVKHLNDFQAGDDHGDVAVTKQDHKNRYQAMIGVGGVGDALLSKYTPTNFQGHSSTYKLRQAEINARPNLNIADLLTFVVGERDQGTGDWSFFYQRSARVPTQVKMSVLQTVDKAVPKNLYHAIRKKLGKTWDFELEVKFKKEKKNVAVCHKITQCARLQFP